MASPVGHAAVGIATASVVARVSGAPDSAALWLGALVASGLPDLDVVAVVLGSRRWHRNATHSLLVAAGLILAGSAVLGWLQVALTPGLLVAWATALVSHPLLDVCTTGPTLGRSGWGIPLLWPMSRRRFYLERPLLVSDRPESRSLRDLLREAREDAARIVPMAVVIIVIARWWP